MAPARLLTRNIRPVAQLADEDFESDEDERLDDANEERADTDADSYISASAPDDEEVDEGSESDDAVQQQLHNVSFGALKQAQATLSRKRKLDDAVDGDQEAKVENLRKRLHQIREDKQRARTESTASGSAKPSRRIDKTARIESDAEFHSDEDSDSGSAVSVEEATGARSKHAPMSQSSKHQVTRKRQVVDVPKKNIRDPRFDALQQRSAHPGNNSEKAYSFLRDYQKAEIQELNTALKATKSEDDKATLRRKMNSMQNRLKAKEAKEREQEIVRKYRKEESDKVKEGKTPYYLKRSEVKERALVERFQDMKGKDREKVIEKRRRKEAQKEKKRMPDARRITGR